MEVSLLQSPSRSTPVSRGSTCLPTVSLANGLASHVTWTAGFKDAPGGEGGGGDADDIMAFVRKKASADWRRLSVSLPFANGEFTASLASAVKEIRDQTSPDSAGTWLPSSTAQIVTLCDVCCVRPSLTLRA